MAKLLFITKQDTIVKKLETEYLAGHFVDIAKSFASAKHYLRNPTCDYAFVAIDENLEVNGATALQFVHGKFPSAKVIGISQRLAAWPETPGPFTHVERYYGPDRCYAWRRDQLEKAINGFLA